MSRLVITRKSGGQGVWIGNALVCVEIVRGQVKLLIEAPHLLPIVRAELLTRPSKVPSPMPAGEMPF